MDSAIFQFINGYAGQGAVADAIGVFLAEDLIYVAGALVASFFLMPELRRRAWLALASVIAARLVVVEAIKRIVSRPRPFEIWDVNLLVSRSDEGMSFSSGHTVILFVLAFALRGTRWFWPMLCVALLGSVARIFIGVHYPSDILASAVIALIVTEILRRMVLTGK